MTRAARIALLAAALTALTTPVRAQRLETEEPLDLLELRARQDSLDAAARYNVALGYLCHERWDAADSALRVAVALDPRFALAHLALAVAEDRNRDYWRRIKREGGDTAVAAERRRREVSARRAYMLDPFVSPRVLVYSAALPREARQALAAGNFFWLYAFLDQMRAEMLQRMRAPVDDSLPAGLLWNHAMYGAQVGRYVEGIADVAALVRLSQHHDRVDSLPIPMLTNELRYVLAALHQRAGRRVQAIALYAEVAENDIGQFMAHVHRASLHEAGAEWSQAVNARRAAIVANPDDPTLVRDLALTLARARRPVEAESVLSGLTASRPQDVMAWYHLGVMREGLGRLPGALEAFDTFLARAPVRLGETIEDTRRRVAAIRSR